MRKKNYLNLIYDQEGRAKRLKGEFNLRNIPCKEYYLNKTHLIYIACSSRETVDKAISQLNLEYRLFNSSFGDLSKWYLFDTHKIKEFISRVRDIDTITKKSVGKLVIGENNYSAEFYFESKEKDLFYIISYPAGTSPEKIVSGFVNLREYSSSLSSLCNGERSFTVKGPDGEVRGQVVRDGKLSKELEVTFVDSEAFYDRYYISNKRIKEKYEYSSRVSLEFLLQSLI